jgi:hypothetical protein
MKEHSGGAFNRKDRKEFAKSAKKIGSLRLLRRLGDLRG